MKAKHFVLTPPADFIVGIQRYLQRVLRWNGIQRCRGSQDHPLIHRFNGHGWWATTSVDFRRNHLPGANLGWRRELS